MTLASGTIPTPYTERDRVERFISTFEIEELFERLTSRPGPADYPSIFNPMFSKMIDQTLAIPALIGQNLQNKGFLDYLKQIHSLKLPLRKAAENIRADCGLKLLDSLWVYDNKIDSLTLDGNRLTMHFDSISVQGIPVDSVPLVPVSIIFQSVMDIDWTRILDFQKARNDIVNLTAYDMGHYCGILFESNTKWFYFTFLSISLHHPVDLSPHHRKESSYESI